jgi:hypothetical protein
MKQIVGMLCVGGRWRAVLSCGHEEDARHDTKLGGYRFCPICRLVSWKNGA